MSHLKSLTFINEQHKATGQHKPSTHKGQNNGQKAPLSWAEKVKVTNANIRFTLKPLLRHPPDQKLILEEAMENSDH
ncbi:hypothetical protein SADUNF_Sadunf05G0115300 [Salix dunnii]|uniref:Uncharacterized protein n=1 Tax=Salix dunnii TaxID=1413687 RepID=A0A835K3N7_9ROSI|nr:hypothetical protein SADUNF_Sadunf05G0115300 [Salix dunnii]